MIPNTGPIPNKPMWRDMHKGERVFIVATGPSVDLIDMEAVMRETTFGVGKILFWKGEQNWDYYGVGEHSSLLVLQERLEAMPIGRFYARHEPIPHHIGWIGNADPRYWYILTPAMQDRRTSGHIVSEYVTTRFHGFDDELNLVGWFEDCSAFTSALPAACWLGFSEVFFVGLDMTKDYVYNKKVPREVAAHLWQKSGLSIKFTPQWDVVQAQMQMAYDTCTKNGVKLYNVVAPQYGNDKVLPRVTLEEVL